MNVLLSWLRDYVDCPASAEKLADLLTFAGVEVEGVPARGADVSRVVVAQILESKQHPNADRLSVCRVDAGDGGSPRQIVCGAKNYRVGDKVPLALPGAVLPGGLKIKEGKLRGELSEGMMCSGRELGLSEDSDGLLILPADAPVGAPLSAVFPADTVLEVEITPNRPDLLSHVGLAREVSALTGAALRPPEIFPAPAGGGDPGLTVAVEPDAREACPFYTGTRVDGVRVGPSPEWLRARLEAAGLRPINNVVDVTNYVMLELGQPLHAFDFAKLGGGGVRVRLAQPGETLRALDGRDYRLQAHHCLIADAEGRGEALAGVMGGEESGVTSATTSLVLEAAYFLPSLVRRTSRELGLSSDASYRFERGVDPGGVERAARRALALILEVAGGTARPMVTAGEVNSLAAPREVPLRLEKVGALLGIAVPKERVDAILSALGLAKVEHGGWEAPSFRDDLRREADLIEEVARVVGLDAIPGRAQGRSAPSGAVDRAYDARLALRRRLVGLGFFEARTLSLVPARDAAGAPDVLGLRNPLSEDQTTLRPGLVPGLLHCAARNARAGRADLRLFELGRVFSGARRPDEPEATELALLLTGAAAPPSWRGETARSLDLADLRGVVEALLPPSAALEFRRVERADAPLATELFVDGKPLGLAWQLSTSAAAALDLRAPCLVADLDADALLALAPEARRFAPLPRFPAVTRDIALLAPRTLPHAAVAAALRDAQEPLLAGFAPFDVWTDPSGAKIAADRKSVAYSLTYRAPDRTLTAEEVQAAHARVKQKLQGALGVEFRE